MSSRHGSVWTAVLALTVIAGIVSCYLLLAKEDVAQPAMSSSLISDSTHPAPCSMPLESVNTNDKTTLVPTDYYTDLSITELFDALLKAASNSDQLATARIRAMLEERDSNEVGTAAEKLLRIERSKNTDSALAKRNRIVNLMYFVVRHEPEVLFSELRTRWNRSNDSEDRVYQWTSLERLPLDYPASTIIDSDSNVEASAVARLIANDLAEAPYFSEPALLHLIKLYGTDFPRDELPDPWLSVIVATLKSDSSRFDSGGWLILRRWLESIIQQHGFSERLHVQASALLSTPPNSFWDMMDRIAVSRDVKTSASAFRELISLRALTDDEVTAFLDLFESGHGSDPDASRRFMSSAIQGGGSDVAAERWRECAAAFLNCAMVTDNSAHLFASVELLAGMRFAWGHRSPIARARGPLISAASNLGVDQLVALYKKIYAVQDRDEKAIRNTSARLIELVWVCDAPVEKRLAAANQMIGMTTAVNFTAFIAIVNGLERVLEELNPGHGGVVAALLDTAFERASELPRLVTPEDALPLMPGCREAILLPQFARILLQLGHPKLGATARAFLHTCAERLDTAIPGWTDESHRYKSLSDHVAAIIQHYSYE